MRFIFMFMLLFSSTVFAAEDTTSVATPAATPPATTAPAGPIDALKHALHKKEQPKTVTQAAVPVAAADWMTLPRASRDAILKRWQQQPEATRQPFPVFRDSVMAKISKKASITSIEADSPPESDQDDDGAGE